MFMSQKELILDNSSLWYKDAIIYELPVKTFYDGNNDGYGDFAGLTEKLDYLEGLGVNVLWLLPYYPSPLKDDGYDISDYYNIRPEYGGLSDFKKFLKEAHRRGIYIITELVLNHTSDQHKWFQRARKAKKGSKFRDYYVWSDTYEKFGEARIIFEDFEKSNWAWDEEAQAYFWHRFYSHQPDLNYDSPYVQKEILKVVDYWLRMGVDGLRLDAVPYLFQRRGTNCENLPETFDFLKKLRAHVDSKFRNKMFLAEANQWPEDAVKYFGDGNSCHMAFHFPLMPRMFMAIQMEDRFPIIDTLEQTPAIPDNCQWALFLRNHDELTLEMVSAEERDFMYKVYARDYDARLNLGIRRRLAPLLDNNRSMIEVMNVLLFSLPGTPIIYYGDEISMGDNYYLGDRDGVRTPMQWSADRNAGFSSVNPQKLYLPVIIDPDYHYGAVNVEKHERISTSFLRWMKRLIAIRKSFKAFSRGTISFILSENPKVLAFIRNYKDENILVVVNLSRYPQVVELDLEEYSGYVPEEVFGRNDFPIIKDSPYILSLGDYGYYFFILKREERAKTIKSKYIPFKINVKKNWEEILSGKLNKLFEEKLKDYVSGCRWFGGKSKKIESIRIVENIKVGKFPSVSHVLFLNIGYGGNIFELYFLPVTFSTGEKIKKIMSEHPESVICRLTVEGTRVERKSDVPQRIAERIRVRSYEGIIYDALYDSEFRKNILQLFIKRNMFKGLYGSITSLRGLSLQAILNEKKGLLFEESQVLKAEQSNNSFIFDNRLYCKFYRRIDEGINPEVEIVETITEKTSYKNVPPFIGTLKYTSKNRQPVFIALMQNYIKNQGDMFQFTIDELDRYFERVISRVNELKDFTEISSHLVNFDEGEFPELAHEIMGGLYLEIVTHLGRRTAELHMALSSVEDNVDFAPENFTILDQRSLYQSMYLQSRNVLRTLKNSLNRLNDDAREKARKILNFENMILDIFKLLIKKKIKAKKIRIHGDLHLGQIIFTGNDFIFIDFEGEPVRSLSERRLKSSPLRDLAGMVRSFHYAAYIELYKQGSIKKDNLLLLEPWTDLWYMYVSRVFLKSYINTLRDDSIILDNREDMEMYLNIYILDKAIYEIGYELDNRPEWAMIPIRGIEKLLGKYPFLMKHS